MERIDPKVPISRWRATSCSESIWAASVGDIRTLQRLLSEQRDLEAGDYDGRTPLHLAAAEGHTEVVVSSTMVLSRDLIVGAATHCRRNGRKAPRHHKIVKKVTTDLSLPMHSTHKDNKKMTTQ